MYGFLAAIAGTPRTRIGPATTISGEVVRQRPADLAAAAGEPLDIYAAGRLGESEEGSAPAPALLAVIEVTRNRAADLGLSIADMLVRDNDAGDAGYFGRQSGRWASTAKDPTRRSIQAAKIAIQQRTNVAGGARKFFSPRVQDGGMQAGQTLANDATDIVRKWGAEGYRFAWEAPIYQLGVNPYDLMLFVPSRKPAPLGQALQAVYAGRWKGTMAGAVLIAAGIFAAWHYGS